MNTAFQVRVIPDISGVEDVQNISSKNISRGAQHKEQKKLYKTPYELSMLSQVKVRIQAQHPMYITNTASQVRVKVDQQNISGRKNY